MKEENAKFFSIIMPVYNSESYLRDSIESVLRQTYDSWELILIDDGSTDKSGQICDEYINDSRIKVFHQENSGEYKSRILGMSVAVGEYILGLDSDDYLDDKCLETVREAVLETDCDMIWFPFRLFGDRDGTSTIFAEPGKIYSRDEIIIKMLSSVNFSMWNKAFKSEVIRKTEFRDPGGKRIINADYVICTLLTGNVATGYVVSDYLYNYRIHAKSISRTMCSGADIIDVCIATKYILEDFENRKIINDRIKEALYIAYLNIISFRILFSYSHMKITPEQSCSIHNDSVYIDSEVYEKRGLFKKSKLCTLYLFRHEHYLLLRCFARIFCILTEAMDKMKRV